MGRDSAGLPAAPASGTAGVLLTATLEARLDPTAARVGTLALLQAVQVAPSGPGCRHVEIAAFGPTRASGAGTRCEGAGVVQWGFPRHRDPHVWPRQPALCGGGGWRLKDRCPFGTSSRQVAASQGPQARQDTKCQTAQGRGRTACLAWPSGRCLSRAPSARAGRGELAVGAGSARGWSWRLPALGGGVDACTAQCTLGAAARPQRRPWSSPRKPPLLSVSVTRVAAGQKQADAQGPIVSMQLLQCGQAGHVQEQQRGTVDDHRVEAGRRGHQRGCAAPSRSLPPGSPPAPAPQPGAPSFLLATARPVSPREAVQRLQEEVFVERNGAAP